MTIRNPNALHRGAQELEWLRRHLCYEVQMMRQGLVQLQHGSFHQFERNKEIEAFVLHARNLVEFFKAKDPCDVDLRRFVGEQYRVDRNFLDGNLEKRMNRQIAHLTAQRVHDGPEKLGNDDFKKISEAIETEILRFKNSLAEDVKKIWINGLAENNFSAVYIITPGPASATNSIVAVKSK